MQFEQVYIAYQHSAAGYRKTWLLARMSAEYQSMHDVCVCECEGGGSRIRPPPITNTCSKGQPLSLLDHDDQPMPKNNGDLLNLY